jgi:hypothetical protein
MCDAKSHSHIAEFQVQYYFVSTDFNGLSENWGNITKIIWSTEFVERIAIYC